MALRDRRVGLAELIATHALARQALPRRPQRRRPPIVRMEINSLSASQSRTAFAVNSAPLSDRMCAGGPASRTTRRARLGRRRPSTEAGHGSPGIHNCVHRSPSASGMPSHHACGPRRSRQARRSDTPSVAQHDRPQHSVATGLELSLDHLFQDQRVQRQIRHRFSKPGSPFPGPSSASPAWLLGPRIDDASDPTHSTTGRSHRPSPLAEPNISLTQHSDDLLRSIIFRAGRRSFKAQNSRNSKCQNGTLLRGKAQSYCLAHRQKAIINSKV